MSPKVSAIFLIFTVSAGLPALAVPTLTERDRTAIEVAQAYFSQLKHRQVIGFEYLVSNPGERVESYWGHSSLRVIDDDDDDFNDLVFSFAALTGEDRYKVYVKGMAGYYALYPMVSTMASVLEGNSGEGGRFFTRVPLTLPKNERGRLLDSLEKWIAQPESSPRYYFLNRNCSFGIFHLFDMAQIRYTQVSHTPHGVVKKLRLSGINRVAPINAHSTAHLAHKMRRLLANMNTVKDFDAQKVASVLSTHELYLLLTGDFNLNPIALKGLNEVYQTRPENERPEQMSQVYKIQKFPAAIYTKE